MVSGKIGAWAFIVGLVIAILAGFMEPTVNVTYALVLGVIGLIVGVLNVSDKEIQLFLIASLAFLLAASSMGSVLGTIPALGAYIPTMLSYIVVMVGPAAAIVGLKAIYEIAKD